MKMNAQQLLEFLLAAANAGVDLRRFEVITLTSVYDELGQGSEVEVYPEQVELDEDYLVFR
jgi:hypothetical protein